MSGHTPGPWEFDPENNGNEQGYGNGITTVDRGWTLAHVPHRNPQWEANARLIAAAPDLLEAAAKAEAGIGDWRLGAELPDDGDMRHMTAAEPYLRSVLASLRAAIAKAEGK